MDKHRTYKELADVLSVEEFDAQIRALHTGIQSVKQNLKAEMYRAMYPPDNEKRPSELAEAAAAKKAAASAGRGEAFIARPATALRQCDAMSPLG